MKRKSPYQYKIHVPEEKEGCVKDFLKICEREGESGSKKLVDFISKYVEAHKNGNPQLRMESFITNPMIPIPKCNSLISIVRLHGCLGWCNKREGMVTNEICNNCKKR